MLAWFAGWVDFHCGELFPRCPWGGNPTQLAIVEEALEDMRATEDETRAASRKLYLSGEPPRFESDWWPKLQCQIQQLRSVEPASANDLHTAHRRREVDNCPHCSNTGKIVVRLKPEWGWVRGALCVLGPNDRNEGPRQFVCWCPADCRLAQADKARIRENPQVSARIPEVSQLPPKALEGGADFLPPANVAKDVVRMVREKRVKFNGY